jgi:hypothetical protein
MSLLLLEYFDLLDLLLFLDDLTGWCAADLSMSLLSQRVKT